MADKMDKRSFRENRERMNYMRQRLNRLASLPEKQLQAALDKWPPYQEMNRDERRRLMERIKSLKEDRAHAAMKFAQQEGIDVPIKKEAEFVNDFWQTRLRLDRHTWREIRRLREDADKQLKQELVGKYGEVPSSKKPKEKKDSKKKAKGTPAPDKDKKKS